MGMWDDVVVNARSAANAVGQKASQLVDISKLRISATDLNVEIGKKYESLGRAVYDAQKAGADPAQAVSETVMAIDDLKEQLEAINAQLAAARNKSVCGYCGHENAEDAVFCSKCGHRIAAAEEQASETAPEDAPEEVDAPDEQHPEE